MQKHYNYLNIDLDKKIHTKLKAKQGDSKSRYILVNLISNSTYYDLSDCAVKIYGIKKDKTIFFNHATVTNAKQGQFEIELTTQALAVTGQIEIQILISGTNDEKLTTFSFFIDVEKTIIDDTAIESTNEFTALTEALSSVQNIDNRFREVDEQFNTIDNKTDWVYPELFGAVGDGVTDDSLAFDKMFATGKKIKFYRNGNYRVGNIKSRNDLYVVADNNLNVTISLFQNDTSPVLLGFGNNSIWKNINFYSTEENLEWSRGTIEDKNNICIENCSFEGFRHTSDRPNAWGLYMKRAKNIEVKNCTFNNNSQSDIAILEGCDNIILDGNKGDELFINLEPNNSYELNNINILNSNIDTLNVLENSYTLQMIKSCIVNNCTINNLNYRGANVSFVNTKVNSIKSNGDLFHGCVDTLNSFSSGINLVNDFKLIGISSTNDGSEWYTGYTPHFNNLERVKTNFGTCLRLNPMQQKTTLHIISKKYEVEQNKTYMLRIKSASHYITESAYVANFGAVNYYNNDTLVKSKKLIANQAQEGVNISTNARYNTCFIDIGENITHIELDLCNSNGSQTYTSVDIYSVEIREVLNGIGLDLYNQIDKNYVQSIPSKVNVAGTKNLNLKGEVVYLKSPTSGGYLGYVCTVSGNPGTWKGFGLIES